MRALATLLKGEDGEGSEEAPPREVVVLWGERLTAGPTGAAGAQALLELADNLGVAGVDGAGLLELPAASNGRGLREAGVLPNAGPGLSELSASRARATRRAIAAGSRRRRAERRSTCCSATRCASCPTASCGSARWRARARSSPTPRS